MIRADSPKRDCRDGDRDSPGVGRSGSGAVGVAGKREERVGLGEVKLRGFANRLDGLGERGLPVSSSPAGGATENDGLLVNGVGCALPIVEGVKEGVGASAEVLGVSVSVGKPHVG